MNIFFEIFKNFPQDYAKGFLMNMVLFTIVYLIFWKFLKNKTKNLRIQFNQSADAKQIKQEIINAIFASASGVIISCIVYFLSTKGYTKVYKDINDYPSFFAYAGFFILLIFDDAWFYWTHRLMHHQKIYKYVHVVHHKSIDVTPYTSLSFHPVESIISTFWIIPVSFVFPMYLPALMVLQTYGLLDNIKSHLGYEFFPKGFNKSWLGFLSTSTYHNMHHSKFNGNYGVHFRFWDRLCGTEFIDYEQEFNTIKNRANGIISELNISGNTQIIGNVIINYKGTSQISIDENETILESLLREKIMVPHACKKGNCGTCKCQLIKGEVDIKRSRAISNEEIQSGLILICQCKPMSESVEIKVLN